MKLDKQKERVDRLLKIIKENPDLEILPIVNEEVHDPDYSFTVASWGRAELDEIFYDEEMCYLRSDEDALIEDRTIKIRDFDVALTDDESYEKAVEMVRNLEWQKVIVVRINHF